MLHFHVLCQSTCAHRTVSLFICVAGATLNWAIVFTYYKKSSLSIISVYLHLYSCILFCIHVHYCIKLNVDSVFKQTKTAFSVGSLKTQDKYFFIRFTQKKKYWPKLLFYFNIFSCSYHDGVGVLLTEFKLFRVVLYMYFFQISISEIGTNWLCHIDVARQYLHTNCQNIHSQPTSSFCCGFFFPFLPKLWEPHWIVSPWVCTV